MNRHDEIRDLIKASRKLFSNDVMNEEVNNIREKYGIITEELDDQTFSRVNIGKTIEDTIDKDEDEEYEEMTGEESKTDKKQAYRVSGGVIVLHGKDNSDTELTTDEKTAFQETMDEFIGEVSDLVDFNKLNVFPKNVEWSGKIIEFDIEFMFSIGEENGVYIQGDMIKADNEFVQLITSLNTFYDKFKAKWAKVLADRKRTND
jgi:hypothetical protein